MALADRLKDHRPVVRTGTPCSVGVLLAELQGSERAAFQKMLGDPVKRDGWPATDILDALRAEGHVVAFQQINRHRGGRCRCAKDSA